MSESVIRYTLNNGLTVLIEPMHHAPVVAVQAWVNAGAADEDDACRGVAHLHEHMLFKGTSRRGVGEIAQSVEGVGGDINAWTSHDQTMYHVVLPASEVGLGIDVLSDALRHSAFDPEELAREREVVLEEINRDTDNPSRQVFHSAFGQVFNGHPYALPVLGTTASVSAMSRDEILRFYRKFYRPSNVTVVIAGDVSESDVRGHIEKHLGDWTDIAAWEKPPRTMQSKTEQSRVIVRSDDTPHARIMCSWTIPGAMHDDVAALDMLGSILGDGEASRLHVKLYREEELVHSVYGYAYTPQDRGLFVVGGELSAEHVPAFFESVACEMQRVFDLPPSQEELDRVRGMTLAQAAHQREAVQGQARKRGFYQVVAGDYAYEEVYLERLRQLTPADLHAVAKRYLTSKPHTVLQWPKDDANIPEVSRIDALTAKLAPIPAKHDMTSATRGSYATDRLRLPGGGTLLVRMESDCPMVALRAVVPGGQLAESSATNGYGTLLSSIWGLAAEGWPAERLASECERLGGGIGAFAGRNSVGLRADFPAQAASVAVELFLANLGLPSFALDDVEREKRQALAAIESRRDQPSSIAFDMFANALYGSHPYGFHSIGDPAVIASATPDHIRDHWRRLMHRENLVVVATGGFTKTQIDQLLMGLLDLHCEGQGFTQPALPTPPAKALTLHEKLDKAQVHVVLGGLGTTLKDPDRYAIDVLTSVLSGQGGRLFLDLRDKQSLAYSLAASSVEGVHPGQVYLYIGTSPEKVDAALAGLRGHMTQVINTLIPDDELNRAKRYLAGNHTVQLQRTGSRASSMALCESVGLGYDHFTGYPAAIQAVTAADVQRVAKTYFSPERMVQVTVGQCKP